eukprot:m.46143 g.46143  ORF g.46143 m.46143 type:complete len:155 (-) comp10341_c0_seq1:267-731(-)
MVCERCGGFGNVDVWGRGCRQEDVHWNMICPSCSEQGKVYVGNTMGSVIKGMFGNRKQSSISFTQPQGQAYPQYTNSQQSFQPQFPTHPPPYYPVQQQQQQGQYLIGAPPPKGYDPPSKPRPPKKHRPPKEMSRPSVGTRVMIECLRVLDTITD